jgi:hypothetical protein
MVTGKIVAKRLFIGVLVMSFKDLVTLFTIPPKTQGATCRGCLDRYVRRRQRPEIALTEAYCAGLHVLERLEVGCAMMLAKFVLARNS